MNLHKDLGRLRKRLAEIDSQGEQLIVAWQEYIAHAQIRQSALIAERHRVAGQIQFIESKIGKGK